MSHALGKVVFTDEGELYFEYDGTGDYARKHLFDTPYDVESQWRQPQALRDCSCGQSEPVDVMIDYGPGIRFHSTACRRCKLITGPRSLLEAIEFTGTD